MKNKVKKGLVVFLALCMLLTMLPVIGASAASDLEVTTSWRNKSIEVSGVLTDLASTQASIFILEPPFAGEFTDVFANMGLVKAAGQVAVGADGEFSYSCSLTSGIAAGDYTVFVNGAAYKASFTFNDSEDFPNYYVKAGDQISIPIIAQDCEDVDAIKGNVLFDSEFLTLNAIYGANGFLAASYADYGFGFARDAGANGDVIVGYVLFTANADLTEDAFTLVEYTLDYATSGDDLIEGIEFTPAKVNIEVKVLLGDVNCDGIVDLRDAVLLLQFLSDTAGSQPTSKQLRAAEVTGDGLVNTADVVVIMQMCG